ncbi:MAG: riboflavin biosynthesis protein RibF [Chloroflexi bacterium]|nr:riboflavin biosynthesis protein RibF [Chloroflexota bacterium]
MADLCAELEAGRPDGLAAVTFGVFDGVHLGHLHLMRQLRDDARERGLTPVIVTLSNHPISVLRPQVPLVLISSLRERLALLRSAGIEHVIPVTFTKELSLRTAEEFMRALCDCVGLRHFVAGPDFALGHDREGTLPVLASLGEKLGYTVRTADAFVLDGAPVRSTAVRQALSAGDIEGAQRLLGRPFALDGPVVEGEGRGEGLLGFPTANLGVGPLQALPADGIYATWLDADGERYPAATSIGIKPTFHEDGPRVVEAFVLDFAGDLYGRHVRIEFVKRLRDQERFAEVDALVAQMRRDVEATRVALAQAAASASRA